MLFAMPNPLSILVVDDYRDTAESLSDFLHLIGFRSRFALSGTAAEREGYYPPGAVIIDLWMRTLGVGNWPSAFGDPRNRRSR